MGLRASGADVNVSVGNMIINFEEVTATIEDSSAASMSRGRPNGHTRGTVKCSGEITMDTANVKLMIEAARKAGSFQEMEPFDIVMNAETVQDQLNIELFECLIKMSDLLNANANGEEKLTHKLPFEVTGKDFVRINGVPYAPEQDKERLL